MRLASSTFIDCPRTEKKSNHKAHRLLNPNSKAEELKEAWDRNAGTLNFNTERAKVTPHEKLQCGCG